MRARLALALIAAAGLLAAAPASAHAFERIDAVFFAEYLAPEYTIDEGEIVTFGNRDTYLAHGVSSDDDSLFAAPVISRGQVRLLRGAPFLTAADGPYPFHCPLHPGMTAVLNVSSEGAPLPPDSTAPTAAVALKGAKKARLARKRRLRVTLNPSEAVDAAIGASVRGIPLGAAERTYLGPGLRSVTLKLSRSAARRVGRLRGAPRVKVKLTLSDVAGNVGLAKRTRRLAPGR